MQHAAAALGQTPDRAGADRARRRGRAAAAAGVTPRGGFLFFDAAPSFEPGERLAASRAVPRRAGVLLTPGPAWGGLRDLRLCFTAVPPARCGCARRPGPDQR
jgi:hypothetical protein